MCGVKKSLSIKINTSLCLKFLEQCAYIIYIQITRINNKIILG